MTRWLLMLGSNLHGPERVQTAIQALSALGPVHERTEVRATPSRRGQGIYHNALVELQAKLEREPLREGLRRIETTLGRVRDGSGVVAIDIDLLACWAGGRWVPDPHAQAKGEFGTPPTPALLREAGIELE